MSNRINQTKNIFVYGSIAALVILAIAARFFTEMPNFAPFGALALFAGAYIANRSLALALPLVGLFIGDIAMELTEKGSGFYPDMAFVYAAYAITVAIGFILRKNKSVYKVIGLSLTGSVAFFMISNFGVWTMQNTYPHTLAGLATCYAMAVPFIKNTLISDLAFNAILFGSMYFVIAKQKATIAA
ncbi:MAG: DUF6580 family putative transport protein [Bacteroidia bacterium]